MRCEIQYVINGGPMGRLLIAVAFTLLVLLPVIGCQSSLPSTIDESSVRAYADPATEMTLQGLSENDLAKYIQYGNSEFKAAVTQEILDEAAARKATSWALTNLKSS